MINLNYKNNNGFIALISAIIISVVLLLVITNLSLTGFYNRFNILDSELKERSSALAESCVDIVLLILAQNPAYTGNQTITVIDGDTCTIKSITPSSNPIIIDTKAVFKKATTNLNVKVTKSTLFIESWEEVAN
ncbi:MAG: hypothetical protein KBC06_00425 [Candidatus Pacebacteria bacterium]|nr:hypothetical protein [Candidatus Paceibacterota bacterium]